MQDRPNSGSSPQTGESILESPGEVVVTHSDTPPKKPADKKIHPRRPLPPIPQGTPSDEEDNKDE
jgi:hypothetical protein